MPRCWDQRRSEDPLLHLRQIIIATLAAIAVPSALPATGPALTPQVPDSSARPALAPTRHEPVPTELQHYWLVPPAGWVPGRSDVMSAARSLAHAAMLIGTEKPAQALPFIRASALSSTPLAGYAAYLKGLAELGLDRDEAAVKTFAALRATRPAGFLLEAASLQLAGVSETRRDYAAAMALYDDVLAQKPAAPDDVLLRLARAAASAGESARSLDAYGTLYFDWPTSEAAASAQKEMAADELEPLGAGTARFSRELARAERLFTARRYGPAREGFERLVAHSSGDQAELVGLRLAECDYFLRRYQRVREDVKPYLGQASRRAEARYFYLMTTRHIGNRDEYIKLTRSLVEDFPDSAWSEEALNSLASFHIINDEDEDADRVFRDLAARFPSGRYTARASWKIGWWAYRHKRYAEAADVFEAAAAAFPRSDYRPSYLYWAGQAREQVGDRATADDRFQLAVTDYGNSYHGRLAASALKAHGMVIPVSEQASRLLRSGAPESGGLPPTADLVRWLISIEMYDEALDEVLYAERTWGGSTVLQATRSWLLNRRGELRLAINLMRRTYPQFLAAGGETLPDEILKIIFPLDYWPLIRQHAAQHKLDPYLIAALIAQESTFDKDIASSAKAVGLMQIMPATGRRWARRLGIRAYATRKLTVADINVRIGTAYFADLMKKFGGEHVALAAYNAGDSRAALWLRERPGIPRDEFIDDIPFPETQNYVRRVLGTAEDYRRLYGEGDKPPAPVKPAAPKPVVVKK